MARRWRIRHKLLLGLATAIGILALLLAGTLNGLWSYHLTIKSIKLKLAEQTAADKLKETVSRLTLRKGDDFLTQARHLRDAAIPEVRTVLLKFDETFQFTLNEDLPGVDGTHLAGIVAQLNKMLDKLSADCDLPLDGGGVQLGQPEERFGKLRAEVLEQIGAVERTNNDIRTQISADLKERLDRSHRHYQIALSFVIPLSIISLLLMVGGLRFFYSWIFNPIRDLQQGVGRVAEGDFEHRIEVRSGDEMEELASAFNDMTCRLRDLYRDMATQINERSRQLVRSERLASVGFLAAGVAHEINNPLASIAFCSEALEARLEQLREESGGRELDVFTKYLRMIQEEAFRCKKITERLLEVSRNSENKRERTDLVALVQSVLEVTQHHPKSKGKDIVVQPGGAVFAWVCAEEIKSVVINLIFNALESMEEGGRLTIELRQKDGMAEVNFRDTGCGMTREVLENIFEPFFTRSRSGKGTGLGLTITHKIVSQHGGEIEADSPGVDQGSTFRVRLPLQPLDATREETLGYNAAA